MKFGIFDYIEADQRPLQQSYEERLTLVKAAEAAGFYGYHLSEHHATPLSMTPSPSVFLAAAARETSRIRLGTLLFLLPLYHPLRLLEELCMLDHLSGGRLDVGVGKGISPHEFDAYGEDFAQSGEAFEHAFNVIYQGFTRDRIDYSSPRYSFKDVPVVLRPLQRPHPPFWYGLRRGWARPRRPAHGVTLGPADERVAKMIATFRGHWAAHARASGSASRSPVQSPMVGAMRAMFVADSDAEAERIARPAYKVWFDNLAWLWQVPRHLPARSRSPPIYDQSKAAGTLVVGSPERVAATFAAQAERCGHNYSRALLLRLRFAQPCPADALARAVPRAGDAATQLASGIPIRYRRPPRR